MSAEEEDSDKQYAASQKKLEDARKKGEIAKSADLTTAASYTGFLLVLVTAGPIALTGLADAMAILLAQAVPVSDLAFAGSGAAVHGGILWAVVLGTAIWFGGPAVMALISVVAQQAFLFTPSKIAPKLNRISPVTGVKNKLGRQGLFEFAKSSSKLIIYTVVMGVFLVAQVDVIIGAMQLTPRLIVLVLGQMIATLAGIVLLIAIILGGVDFLWQRADHQRKNMMSRKEMMDEHKNSEGDPLLKQQRRQRGLDIANSKMMADVPMADVIIVNPTHFAVALKWNRSEGAPVCVAKGVDETAGRIRALAFEHGVPVHSDPPTARALHAEVEIGQEIAQEHYRAVAAAIRFAEAMRKKAKSQ